MKIDKQVNQILIALKMEYVKNLCIKELVQSKWKG